MKAYQDEISNKERFEFGENWKEFLLDITDTRIKKSEEAIKEMLDLDSLKGKTFLDIGCGHWGKNLVRNFSELSVLKLGLL